MLIVIEVKHTNTPVLFQFIFQEIHLSDFISFSAKCEMFQFHLIMNKGVFSDINKKKYDFFIAKKCEGSFFQQTSMNGGFFISNMLYKEICKIYYLKKYQA